MTAKNYAYKMEKELAEYVGFVIPSNNIVIKENPKETHWTYVEQTIQVPQNAMDVYKDNMAVVDFSISHEFAHMLQDFVINMNINTQNLTKEYYQESINKFFKTDNLVVSDEMFSKFQNFFERSPFADKDIMHAIKFDDRFYVSAVAINACMLLPNYNLYYGNLTEIDANTFASEFVMQKYVKENQEPEIMKQLSAKIDEHLKTIPEKRDDGMSATQIAIRQELDRYKLEHTPFWKKRKVKNEMVEQRKRDLATGIDDLDKYNLTKINKYMTECTQKMDAIITDVSKNHKTKEELRIYNEDKNKGMTHIYELMRKYPNKVTLEDNFVPHPDDNFVNAKAILGTFENLAELLKMNLQFHPDEIVVDLENKCLYFYPEPRIKEMREADNLLESDNVSMPESNDTLAINNDNREDR